MRDLLLPTTDAGVVVQVCLVVALAVLGFWRTRQERATWWPLVGGLAFFVLGLMVLRGAH